MGGSVEVLERGFPGEASLDVAVSRALLDDVARGRRSEVLRKLRSKDRVVEAALVAVEREETQLARLLRMGIPPRHLAEMFCSLPDVSNIQQY